MTDKLKEDHQMDLRVGIIGLGFMGQNHVERVAKRTGGAVLAGVADIRKDLVDQIAAKYNTKGFYSAEELIASDDIDAVMVVNRDDAHAESVLSCIEHNKPVFCEKPLAPTAEGCQEIIDAEMKAGKKFVQVGFMRRYDPGYIEMKEAIDSHRYGEPLLIHATHRNSSVDESYDTPMAIVNTAVHEADMMHWLLGEDYESGVTFLPKKQTKYTHEKLHDPQIVMLDTKSGVHIDLEVFVNDHSLGYDINCNVVCEDGEISLKTPNYSSVKTNLQSSEAIKDDCMPRFKVAYDNEIQQWVDTAKEGKVEGPNAWDGLIATVTCDALAKSRDEDSKRVPIVLPEKPALY